MPPRRALERVAPLLLAATAVALWLRRRRSRPAPALPAGGPAPNAEDASEGGGSMPAGSASEGGESMAAGDASEGGGSMTAGDTTDIVKVVDDLLGDPPAGAAEAGEPSAEGDDDLPNEGEPGRGIRD